MGAVSLLLLQERVGDVFDGSAKVVDGVEDELELPPLGPDDQVVAEAGVPAE
jgi:hypothetical protein